MRLRQDCLEVGSGSGKVVLSDVAAALSDRKKLIPCGQGGSLFCQNRNSGRGTSGIPDSVHGNVRYEDAGNGRRIAEMGAKPNVRFRSDCQLPLMAQSGRTSFILNGRTDRPWCIPKAAILGSTKNSASPQPIQFRAPADPRFRTAVRFARSFASRDPGLSSRSLVAVMLSI